jgi:hypothetical protein
MRSIIACAILASTLVGCGAERVAAPDATTGSMVGLSSAAPLSAKLSGVPLSGSCVLTFGPPPFPVPPSFSQTDVGECLLSHLGQSTVIGVQTINIAAGTQSGQRSFTAANGDVLEVQHVGTSASAGPGLVRFQSTATITGGTGRFTNATGQLRGTGIANLVTRTTTATFEGTINYDASDRAVR